MEILLSGNVGTNAVLNKPVPASQVYDYYQDKRRNAQAGCLAELEGQGRPGACCNSFDNLEKMVYELGYTGKSEDLYRVLKVENNIAKRKAGKQSGEDVPVVKKDDHTSAMRKKAMDLFKKVDTDGNGMIDRYVHCMSTSIAVKTDRLPIHAMLSSNRIRFNVVACWSCLLCWCILACLPCYNVWEP